MTVDLKYGIAGLLEEVAQGTREDAAGTDIAARAVVQVERANALSEYAHYLLSRKDDGMLYLLHAVASFGLWPWRTESSAWWELQRGEGCGDPQNGDMPGQLFSMLAGGRRSGDCYHYESVIDAFDGAIRAMGVLIGMKLVNSGQAVPPAKVDIGEVSNK